MGQKITLKIGGHLYGLVASSPEEEHYQRNAADVVNKMMDRFIARYPSGTEVDRFAFVALNLAVGKASMERRLAEIKAEVEALEKEIQAYIGDAGEK